MEVETEAEAVNILMRDYKLTEYDRKILAVLDTTGGFTTHYIAIRVEPAYCGNRRMHAGAIRSWLNWLEKVGYVRKMDDEKPVCWMLVRTAA